jgi:protein-ribulosamine 3-kinase
MNIWQTIQSEIQDATQTHFLLSEKIPVSGGDINQAFRLLGDGAEYFVKLNSSKYWDMFVQESVGLKALDITQSMLIPKVILHGVFKGQSYLVLEYIKMQRQGDIRAFATALADLHLTSHSTFGFDNDNHIGTTPQNNRANNNWGEFFAEQRIGFQLKLLQQKNVSQSLLNKGQQLLKKLPNYLNRHQVKPALVHGDLWQGNYAFNQAGVPLIFDPACYYADHEVDLAMLELFGNPGREFFEAYNRVYKIEQGYTERKKIYNLYHILNHANLFGGSYINQSEQIINELVKLD